MEKYKDLTQLVEFATNTYFKHFKSKATLGSYAPGRVNLIGEHTDYNDGFVLPMALPLVTVVVGEITNSNQCCILTTCENVDQQKELIIDLSIGENSLKPDLLTWGNYVKGVLANFKGKLTGFNAVIATTVPVGGGLSSSAALEVAMYTFLDALSARNTAKSTDELKNIAKACQKAEHEFCGMPCGIMDQFVSIMAIKDHALLLDCRSLDFSHVPLKDPNVSVLITNTNVRHKLTGSEYPTRRKQCEEAARILKKNSLRDVTEDELNLSKSKMSEVVFRRARHVVSEINRTLKAAKALKEEDYVQVGLLMKESHESLRDDFEVSCPELDQVVDAALECESVYGSRMTGGGFGGCTVTLLETEAVSKVIKNIQERYGKQASFYVCRPEKGATAIELP